jgi:hypothetical protein
VPTSIEILTAMRYVTPLVEGGSLPAVVETEDGDLFVMKFRGAGQGPKALIAELIAGEIGRALGLRVPQLAFVVLDGAMGPSEPNQEISDLLRASVGLNVGLRYLPYSFAYHTLLRPAPAPEVASAIVWFDAYVTNVDRTLRNTNILVWQRQLWLIDHGAALYFHHDWRDYLERSRTPFPRIKDHVLLPFAGALPEAAEACQARLTPEIIRDIVSLVPDVWLDGPFLTPAAHREAYVAYLLTRLEASATFVDEARHARSLLV